MRRTLSTVIVALTLALIGCTDGGDLPKMPQLPGGGGGPKLVVSEDRAPSATGSDGSLRVDQVVRSGKNIAIGLTLATAGGSAKLGRYSMELTTNTGVKLETDKGTDREVPAASVATLTVQATLPEEEAKEVRVELWGDLSVTVPVPAEDGATVWRPAALRQVGLAQEPRQTATARVVFDTIRSDGLVTEVTYRATVPDGERIDVCSYNFQDDKCRLVEPDGTVHPLLGRTEQSADRGGRTQGTLRFLGELDPNNTRLTLNVSAATSGKDLDPIDVTLPTHADSPTQAAAGDLTRTTMPLATPVTATATDGQASITVSQVDVLADRVQLTTRLAAGDKAIQFRRMPGNSSLDSPTGDVFPMLGGTTETTIEPNTAADVVMVFQGAVPAAVTELRAHLGGFYLIDTAMTFSVPVGPADAAPPKPEATLGEVETEQAAPELRVTPAPAAPTPEGTASPTPEPVRVGVSDIKPLPVSTSTRLANPGSWLVREGATPPPAEDPNAEAKAQQSLKDLGAQRTPDGWVLTLPETVLFEYNKYDILPGADAKLTEVGALLAHFADAEIRVQGHTDSTGSADGNATLSKNRADAVAKALSGKGVSASRMTVEGFAAERPVASNATDEGRAKNRRVEIVLREKA